MTLLPDPNPTRYPVFCPIPDLTRPDIEKPYPLGNVQDHPIRQVGKMVSIVVGGSALKGAEPSGCEANTSKLGPPTYLPVTRLSAFVLLRPGAEIVLFLVGKSLA